MPMHLGTTGGLVLGALYCVARGLKARKEGWDVFNVMQECWTGYSQDDEEFDMKKPISTYLVVGGKVVTTLAKWTNYNQDTPKGWNL